MAGQRRVFRWVALAFNLIMVGLLVVLLVGRPCAERTLSCDVSPSIVWGLWFITLLAVWLLGDIVLALIGRSRRRRHWLVSEPGADLTEYPRSPWAVARLGAGSLVTELGHVGGQVRVATEDGRNGWVARERLEPTGEGGP